MLSTELLTLLQRIEKVKPPTEEPPKPSQALTQLLSVMDARRQKEETERDLFHKVKEQKYEIALAKHILNCETCQVELQLAVERYMGHMRGPWYLDLVNDVGGLDYYPNCPQVENYRFGSYWGGTEGEYDTIQFIKDRTSWALHILREEYVDSIRMLRALRRERRLNVDIPYLGILFPTSFWGAR